MRPFLKRCRNPVCARFLKASPTTTFWFWFTDNENWLSCCKLSKFVNDTWIGIFFNFQCPFKLLFSENTRLHLVKLDGKHMLLWDTAFSIKFILLTKMRKWEIASMTSSFGPKHKIPFGRGTIIRPRTSLVRRLLSTFVCETSNLTLYLFLFSILTES